MDESLWYCVDCGCVDVEEIAWVEMNSGAITSGEAPVVHWCPECRSHDTFIDFAVGAQLGDLITTELGERLLHSFDGDPVIPRELP
jgi:hypothetical protein